MKYFKIQKGFNIDDYISIDETELAMAMRAQITGKIGVFNEGTIQGKSIISITPDFNREMGYNRDYRMDGEDYARLGTKKSNEYRDLITHTKLQVENQLGSGEVKQLN